jgi:site-specific recombinase XerD
MLPITKASPPYAESGTAVVPAAPGDVERRDGRSTANHVATTFLLGYTGHTRVAYARDVADWFAFCGSVGLDPLEARRGHVDAWARKLGEIDGRAPSTVARKLTAVSGFYRYAVDEELITRNPASAVRRPRVGSDSQTTGLSKEELGALLDAASAHSARTNALFLLLAMNGLRISEALGADVTDLDTERGHRVLRITRKGGKGATVPLAPRTAEALDSYLADRADGPLFATSSGGRFDQAAVWRLLRRLAATAVPGKARSIHPHDLRHAFVTLALDAGVSLRDVQDAAGHADPRTTRRYDRARYNLDRHPTYVIAGFVD